MYHVLLVDDERIILQGISNVVNWTALGMELVDTARNGIEAYEKISRLRPHIVISDIKMPGMDGLTLVKQVKEAFPATRFIMLSGFSEFEYAQSAMQYGVKHYLLKPTNEHKIMEALREVVADIQEEEHKEQFTQGMKQHLERAYPYIKEQVLKEFISNKAYTNRDLAYYQKLFHLEFTENTLRLVLFQLEGVFDFEHMYAIRNIAEEILPASVLSTNIGEYILLLVEAGQEEELQESLHEIRSQFFQYYEIETTIAISEEDHIWNARKMYQEALECLSHRFYLGEGSMISKKDIDVDGSESTDPEFDEQHFCLLIKSGHWEDVRRELTVFFTQLAQMRLGSHLTKSHVMQLFLATVQACDAERMNRHMEKMALFMEMDRIQHMQQLFEETIQEVTLTYYSKHKTKHSAIIQKVIDLIHEHLGNPELSLKWMANRILYMNADYLGKLFKQETGERFSSYVMKARIEKAVEHIRRVDDVKIGVLAELTGFGDNPQYFSQVFKKHTGRTPSEYRKVL